MVNLAFVVGFSSGLARAMVRAFDHERLDDQDHILGGAPT